MSAIQSRSVRSVRIGAPQLRMVRATSARCAAAALAKSSRSWASMVNSRVTPVSASCSTTSPMSGSSTSRGSSTSMASTSCRAAIAPSGRCQLIGPRKSLMITAMPRRRSGRRSASMAVARSPRTPTGARGVVAMVRSSVCSSWRPDRAGTRVMVAPLAISAPSRLPPPLLRKVIRPRPPPPGRVSRRRWCRSPGWPTCRPPARSPARGRRSSAHVRMRGARGDGPSPSAARHRRAGTRATPPARIPAPGSGPGGRRAAPRRACV
uniref:MAV264 n=1 Tax=Mycobacterium avium TaxID=1764 RepID=O07393_MYCAV|nr:MAV264 [Mycobacterium avium]